MTQSVLDVPQAESSATDAKAQQEQTIAALSQKYEYGWHDTDEAGASVSIGGKMFPLSAITKVYPQDAKIEEENTNFFKTATASIADNISNITNAIFGYEEGNKTPEQKQ